MNDQDDLRRAVRELVDEFGRAADQAARLVKEAVGDLKGTIGLPSAGTRASPSDDPSTATDPFDAIRELAKLRDEGHITEAEFTAKRNQLMERI